MPSHPETMPSMESLPFRANSKGIRLDPRVLLEQTGRSIDFGVLEGLTGRSVLHANQFNRGEVVELAKLAALLESTEIELRKPLDGKIAITAFFEPSTRTRLSFESAVLRLDGKVLSVPDGQVTGIAKGESLDDIGEMFNTYGDIVVMRHPETESLDQILNNLDVPLINAGNGSGQHPTQALLDWYALLKWRPSLAFEEVPEDDRIHLGIVGTPGAMRAVKSFLRMALMFPGAIRKVTIVSEMMDPVGLDLGAEVSHTPIEIENTNNIQDVLGDLDVIYMNSIALLGDSYKRLDTRFRLDAQSRLKAGAVVMHPLARRDELDTGLDQTQHNLYFAQAAGAVFSRQALLVGVFGRAGDLRDLL
jgi:aspartate carbamoyltransferase catalytic subunit